MFMLISNIFCAILSIPFKSWENLIGIGSFILILSILILVHELGHFLVAKKVGIKVEVFSLGFGKKILKRKKGDTEYCLSILPLGGYVKMAGDEPAELREGKPDEYLSKSPAERAAVVIAGPLMNYIFAFLVFIIVLFIGKPQLSTKIGTPRADSPALNTGLKSGDIVLAIDNITVNSWEEMTEVIRSSKNLKKHLVIKRENIAFSVDIDAKFEETKDILGRPIKVPIIGVMPYLAAKIGDFTDNSAAEKSGLKKGDEIIAIDGQSAADGYAVLDIISKKQNELDITVIRGTQKLNFKVMPDIIADKEQKEKFGDIGVMFDSDIIFVKYNFFACFYQAGKEIYKLTKITYTAIGRLLVGKMSLKTAGTGPVGIAFISIQMATKGVIYLALLLASLSVSLAIVNLIPFPVLDGGHILFLALEKIRGKAISVKAQENINKIALALLITLFLYITWSDLEKFAIIDNLTKFISTYRK